MIRFLMSLCLVAAMSVAAAACPCVGDDSPCACGPSCNCEAGATYGVINTAKRVVDLPQDQNKLYLTILGDPASKAVQKINSWFAANATLHTIQGQTHFNVVPTSSILFKERYAPSTPATPCVRLQAPNGFVLSEFVGDKLPLSAEALANGLNTECWRRHKNRCPNCPAKPEQPQTDPEPQPLEPAVTPEPEPVIPHAGILAALCGVALAIGGSIGLAKKWKEINQGQGHKSK